MKKGNKQDKKLFIIRVVSISFLLIFLLFIGIFLYYEINDNTIKNVTIDKITYKYNKDKNNMDINIKISNKTDNTVFCNISDIKDEKENTWQEAINNTCTYTVDLKEYYIYLMISNEENKKFKLSKYINGAINYELYDDVIYLAPSEKTKIKQKIISINNIKPEYVYDKNIISISDDGIITANKKGETTVEIKLGKYKEKLNVNVSSLIIKKPSEYDLSKAYLPCEAYSHEDAQELDKILENKVKRVGYKTRAGVVEAARFLTLEFPYKINYYLENGRLDTNSGMLYVDGEGRYYHKGLYLDSSKYEKIISSYSGPSMWGCPLPYNSYNKGYSRDNTNGLDCSGFITWAFVNGGFDPGDKGAGDFPYEDKALEAKNTYRVTEEFLNQRILKAGDIIYYWGHVAMIAGIKNDDYYVSEALWYDPTYAVVIKKYNKYELIDEFTHVMLLDDYYQDDGEYTEFWEY